MLGAFLQAMPVAWAQDQTERAIAIAYDNSGSMFQDTAWNTALYSVEVLAAMLDSGDSLAVFAMDEPGLKISVEGSQNETERVRAIHENGLGEGSNTPTRPAQEAWDYLKTVDKPKKYLVITTDGVFDEGLEEVQNIADSAAAEGMEVLYLAIGDGAVEIRGNESEGVYVKKAASDTILEAMTEVGNQIFGRAQLGSEYVDKNTGELRLDVPVKSLIVFAQGENVSVGGLSNNEGLALEPRTVSVKYANGPYPGAQEGAYPIDKRLQGVVATFDGTDLAPGLYHLDVSGAEDLAVYYVLNVGIAVSLTDSENGAVSELIPGAANELYAGTFTPNFSLIDPNTHQTLSSPLLEPADYTLTVTQNGHDQKVKPGDSLQLEAGTADFFAEAVTAGGARPEQTYQGIAVGTAPKNLIVDASAIPDSIDVGSFLSAAYPVTVTHQDGSELTPEEWEALEPSISDASGVPWTIEKSGEGQTLIARPTYGDGDEWAMETRLFGPIGLWVGHPTDVVVGAQATVGDAVYEGEAREPVTFTPNVGSALLHDAWWMILLAAFFVYLGFWIAKPRLPRGMKPNLDVGGMGATIVPLKYSEKRIQHRGLSLRAETVSFRIVPKTQAQAMAYPFNTMFGLQSLGLVATKKKRGKRAFHLDDKTTSRMNALNQNPGTFPQPNFAPVNSLGTAPGKGVVYTAGSLISFQGLNPAGNSPINFLLKFK